MSGKIWSSDDNFTSGPFSGMPTKVAPSSGLIAQGIAPEQRIGARQFNWLMNLVSTALAEVGAIAYANWERRTPSGTPVFRSASFPLSDNSLSVVVAVGDSAAIQTSSDFVTWTARTPGGAYTDDLRSVANNALAFVAVGETGGIQRSTDGFTWSKRTADSSYTGTFHCVAANGAATGTEPDFVAVGTSGAIQGSSDGGSTWDSHVADASYASTFASVAFDPVTQVWCAVGAGGEIQTAEHGAQPLTWSRRRTGTEASGFVAPRPGGGFIVVLDDSTSAGKLLVSADGRTFVELDATLPQPRALCIGPDGRRAVVASAAGNLWDAPVDRLEGDAWVQRLVSPASTAFLGLASSYGCATRGEILAVGDQLLMHSLRIG